VSSCKLYMTYEALKLRDGELLDIMLACRKHNFTTMIHAENGDIVEWMTKKLEEKGMTEPYHHYTSRPPIVEAEATNRAISLSEIIQIPILLVHVSAPVFRLSLELTLVCCRAHQERPNSQCTYSWRNMSAISLPHLISPERREFRRRKMRLQPSSSGIPS
jgi:hypothetical protein